MGPITARLFEQEAPQTVSHFVGLATGSETWRDPKNGEMAARPLYRDLTFDRVIPDFVIQAGDPTNTGRYDCGSRVKDEFAADLKFDRPGRLGVMNLGEPDSGGCEFFITNDAYAALDRAPDRNGYTIFGQVVAGQDVVAAISNVPSDAKGTPRTPVKLLGVAIRRLGPEPSPAAARQAAPKRKFPKLD
jgi:peptidyl-prolyl cis-trans isomerase A (cyclophilin A)